MSSNSLQKINQKEYLKKYLSGDKVRKKKKSRRHKLKDVVKVKIIDDNAGTLPEPDVDEELLLTGEDAPQIVATYVEEDTKGRRKWRSIAIKEEEEEVSRSEEIPKASAEDDMWGPKPIDRRLKDEFSPPRRINNADGVSKLVIPAKSVKIEPKSPNDRNKRSDERNLIRDKHDLHEIKGDSEGTGRHSVKQAPPHRRKRMNSSDKSSPHRRKRTVSADQSPQRQRRRDRSETQNPHRHKRGGDSTDQSPLRRNRRSADQSSPRRKKRESSSDQSPPRLKKRGDSTDQSPVRRKKRSADQSPHRRKKRESSSEQSPMRLKRRRSSEGRREHSNKRDNSVRHSPSHRKKDDEYAIKTPYRSRRRENSADQSPKLHRRQNFAHCPQDEGNSSEPKRHGHRRHSKIIELSHKDPGSLTIKVEKPSPDLSPIRKSISNHKNEISQSFKKEPTSPGRVSLESKRRTTEEFQSIHRKTTHSLSPPPTHKPKSLARTIDGKRTGLQDAETLRQECSELRRKEEELFAQMPVELSGRDAEVQVRSYGRRGKRAEKAQNIDPEEEQRKEAHEKKKKELYDRWGKGLKQIEEYRAKIDKDLYEGSKPLARYSNDADLEKYLRDQERADDPMLEYMRKKRKDQQPQTNTPTMPTYQGTYPENRFGIRPGYRWDGVDRSNGYETKWFDIQNEKRAQQDEAYKYSVEDL